MIDIRYHIHLVRCQPFQKCYADPQVPLFSVLMSQLVFPMIHFEMVCHNLAICIVHPGPLRSYI
jgi:hypothetical protein